MRILLVDDDSFLLDMYATKFQEASYEVDTAKTVEAALKQLREGLEFDVVLLDMVLPGLSGNDLLKAIRTENLGGTPKCIVLSNQGEQSDIELAKQSGADGYIIKADTIPSQVVNKVGEFLS